MRQQPPLGIPSHCQCSHDDPGMCSFCEWEREEGERDAHDEAFADPTPEFVICQCGQRGQWPDVGEDGCWACDPRSNAR